MPFGSFAHKHARVPRGDFDCEWDYLAAKCKHSEYCEYRYVFGDLTLDQSCRLKPSVRQMQIVPPSLVSADADADIDTAALREGQKHFHL